MMATEMEQPLPMVGTIPTASCSPQSISTPSSAQSMMMGGEMKTESVSPPLQGSNSQSSAPRRPPRKSTLTQQQKNQKRQRATQDQLTLLEMEFNKNPTPTATVRDRIADDIAMTERSVQIWFQNRRAKIKLLAKKSLETGEDIDSIPESMRNYLAMQAMESGKGLGGTYLGRTGLLPFGPNNGGMLLGGDQSGQGKVLIHHLTCRSLAIGKWTRVGQNTMDLVIFYSPDKCTMTYYINNEQAGYKIEYPFSSIKNIFLESNDGDPSQIGGGIVIELNRTPNFMMDSSPTTTGFFPCGDFTEDMQASHCLVHHLGGNPKVLSSQLAKLVSLESFMNRHNPQPFADPHALAVSAPVSPIARPSSQPSFQQPHVGMFQETWGISNMHSGGMRPQGHKRQRSRSVPGPIDFAMFQHQPMPSFYIQPPGDMGPPQHNPNIYAPIPQQPHVPVANLRIDTQAGFGLDMRQYPMSATAASPAEFSQSPSFFTPGPDAGHLTGANFHATYGGGYLSPMPGGDNGASAAVSPMPYNGPTEPSIVEQSPPPMSMMGRPGSADIYGANDGSCAISDDGTGLNDMYSKHNINLPMHHHSPGYSHSQQHTPQQQELDMDSLVHFDTIDPSSLSAEAMSQATH